MQIVDWHCHTLSLFHENLIDFVSFWLQSPLDVPSLEENEVDEMIEKEIDQIFLAAEAYRVRDLPPLTAQVVLDNRIMPMVSKKYANPLPVLAELRFWHARKLLTTEHLAIACKELVGEKVAQQLLSGDAKSQQAVVNGLLSNNAAEGAESGPTFR